MSVALYRKYRPKTFAEVTGQKHIKITLQNEIVSGRVVHAYLFCGPRGTGKTTMARLLAKAVNCLAIQEQGEPCNQCTNCLEIMENRALDIIEMDAASHTGVDNVRENIIQNVRFTPSKSKFKVFIIDEVHMLSLSAFNALLKILEEAPKYVIFILATTEAHKVPSTIISRCQRFDFKKISFAELVRRLEWIVEQEELKVEDTVLKLIARRAGGCVRDAESLLEQVLSLGGDHITCEQAELILPRTDFDSLYQLLELINRKQTAAALDLVGGLVQEGVDLNIFVDNFIEFVRKVLLYKITGDLEALARDVEEEIVQKILTLTTELKEGRLATMIREFLSSKDFFKQSYLPQLGLEMAIIALTESDKTAIDIERGKVLSKQNIVATPASQNVKAATPREDCPLTDEGHAASTNNNVAAVSVDLACWDDVLEQVKDKNYSLYMSLRMGRPVRLENDVLTIGFVFELQRQRVEKVESKRLVAEIVENVFGRKLIIETHTDPTLQLVARQNNNHQEKPLPDSWQQIAAEFGGEVVRN